MSRILSIDYGKKRTGLAVTDPLQIIANGLTTVETKDLFDFLSQYVQKEEVERIVVGKPMQTQWPAVGKLGKGGELRQPLAKGATFHPHRVL